MWSQEDLQEFLTSLGATEEPFGVFYTEVEPQGGVTPKAAPLPAPGDEEAGNVDWDALLSAHYCVVGVIWRARRKKVPAYFDKTRFACLGGAFYLGFLEEMLDSTAYYVAKGIPGVMEGERYLDSPESSRRFFKTVAPRLATAEFCVFKPLSQFTDGQTPELVVFFERPETMAGLTQLAVFVTKDFEAVKTPFGSGCSSMVSWPLKYMTEGLPKAVLGGWDLSERKYLKHDELTLSIPLSLFEEMLKGWKESFLITKTWAAMKKRKERSDQAWANNS